MKSYRLSSRLGIIFGSFHFFIVGLVLLKTGGTGEEQGYFILLLDYPLYLLLNIIPGGEFIMFKSHIAYLTFFPIAGTIMYALAGMTLGYAIEKISGSRHIMLS